MRVPKYGDHNLTSWRLRFWSLWTGFTFCCPLSWLPIWLWNVMMDPYFIYCHTLHERILFIALMQRSKSSTCSCFWSIVSKRDINYEQSFSCSNIHAKWWIHCLLISLRCQLSHTTSIHDRPKPFCGLFYVFWNNCRIWVTRAFNAALPDTRIEIMKSAC